MLMLLFMFVLLLTLRTAVKARVIEKFLLNSTQQFWNTLEMHFHVFSMKHGAWSEKLWQTPTLWVGSENPCDPQLISDHAPPEKDCYAP